MGRVVRYPTGKAHLVDDGKAECGSYLSESNVVERTITRDCAVVEQGHRWCYSCIGNALQKIEENHGTQHQA